MPKYSVIMPAKNSEKTIESAIRSVFFSFPRDIEVVVWDDGSIDRTSDVAQSVDKKRVRIMHSSTSVGGGVARQRIIDATDSDFIVNQDSDDISLPWRHEVQSRLINNADIVFSAVNRFSNRYRLHRPTLPLNYSSQDVHIALLFHNPLSHPTMLAKRTALSDINGYSTSRVAQDYEFLLRAAANEKIIVRSGLPALLYRMSSTQISQQPDYADRIMNSPEVLNSYGELVTKLIPFSKTRFSNSISRRDIENIDPQDIKGLIKNLSPHLQPFYRHLVRSRRFGHIGQLAFCDPDE